MLTIAGLLIMFVLGCVCGRSERWRSTLIEKEDCADELEKWVQETANLCSQKARECKSRNSPTANAYRWFRRKLTGEPKEGQ